jgi:hypothetical protein
VQALLIPDSEAKPNKEPIVKPTDSLTIGKKDLLKNLAENCPIPPAIPVIAPAPSASTKSTS